MPIHNADIASVFDEIADWLEIQGANVFRVRAYRNAARTLRDLSREVSEMVEANEDLTGLPGIGKDLAGKIREMVAHGPEAVLEEYRKGIPKGVIELMHVPGLGPKRAMALHRDLGIDSLEALREAARDGRIRRLPGFGEKTEQHLLKALEEKVGAETRFKLAIATQYAEPLVAYLKQVPGVKQVIPAGSYRRGQETIGDLDILVTAAVGSPVMDRFVAYDEVAEVMAHGTTKSSVRLKCKLQVDVRVVVEESYGAALQYFTGSKAHNVALRQLGVQRGLKINEYGVFKGEQRIAGETEESVYAAVGLPWIPPELRENRGEIEAAQAKCLPKLVTVDDVRGDLHVHTNASDGRNTLREMALAAKKRGLEYIAITDHSKHLGVAKGLDVPRLLAHMEQIDKLNEELAGITLLKGIEVDILQDGGLDLPDDVLGKLDLVVGAVHDHFELPREQQTARILRAMDHPHFTLLAHPSGRLIGERAPYDVDIERVIRHAKERGCFLEVNCHPERLDLIDTHCQMAKAVGVLLSINTDAHSALDFDNLRFGVGQARRGWLEKKDVLNTRSLRELKPLLKRTMA